jgi:hypothetical protein
MVTTHRKKSPRAPSVALGDAIDKVTMIYNKDRCHPASIDTVAQHLGYKSAENGAALSTFASLKYYGLLERPAEGMLAVSKDVEAYLYAPNEVVKQVQISKWLKSPQLFAELLDKYADGLPSDPTLKFELIQRGFTPATAENCLQVFRRSVEFSRHLEQLQNGQRVAQIDENAESGNEAVLQSIAIAPVAEATPIDASSSPVAKASLSDDVDRIPVRLAGGRKAWIEIPMPFFAADKVRLKKQIDLLLTDDEENVDDVI